MSHILLRPLSGSRGCERRITLKRPRNAQKYIALFPSSQEDEGDEDETRVLKLPKLFKKPKSKDGSEAKEEDESSIKRRQVLERIAGMMESGLLPTEPELVVGETKTQVELGGEDSTTEAEKKTGKKDKKEKSKKDKVDAEVKGDDDFFDVDDE